ncbi:uncharacterized protein LOC126819665 isoform X1 [Patella vulgata]|uniref:uncharacterized protein LOC126819665 isoform X1 n=2 Tax=Patella vulgata TaxID=6465 RepID=UPI00217F230E|nr:uncharacterized protein LOC126819665 isoform X1 [Patella vulgata]
MDGIIQKHNFMKVKDSDIADEFNETLQEWVDEHENKLNTKMVLDSLKIVQNQVCQDSFSHEDSPPGQMATYAFEHVISAIGVLVDNDKAKYISFYEALYNFFIKLLSCGPGSIHIKFIGEIIEAFQFQDYVKSLPADKIKPIISGLKRKYSTEDGTEDYHDRVDGMIRQIIDYLFSEEQFKKYETEFVELYEYFKENTDNKDPQMKSVLSEKADSIEYELGGNIYKALNNPDAINKQWDKLLKIALETNFPKDDEDLERVTKPLSSIVDALKENGVTEITCGKIMNFLIELFKKKEAEKIHQIVDDIGYFFYHLDEDKHPIKKNEKLFTLVANKLIELLKVTKSQAYLEVKLVDAIISEVLIKSMGSSKEHVAIAIEIMSMLLKYPIEQCINAALEFIREKEKILKWKEHLPMAQAIFKTISLVNIPDDDSEVVSQYVSFMEYFLAQLKKSKVLADLNDALINFAMGVLVQRNEKLFELGSEASSWGTFDVKKNKSLLFEVLQNLAKLFQDEEFPWNTNYSDQVANNFVSSCMTALEKNGKTLTSNERGILIELVLSIIDKDFIDEDTGEVGSVYFCTFCSVYQIIELLDAGKEIDRVEPFIPHLFNLLDHDNEDVVTTASNCIRIITSKSAKVLAPVLDKLILLLLKAESFDLMSAVNDIYEYNQEPVKKRFQDLFKLSVSGDESVTSIFYMFLSKVAKNQPELFTDSNIKTLIQYSSEKSPNEACIVSTLDEIAKRLPEKLVKYTDAIIKLDGVVQYSTYYVYNILKWIAIKNEKNAELIMKHLAKRLEGPEDALVTYAALDAVKHIGGKHKAIVEKYRGTIERLKASSVNQTTKDLCTGVIDMLEGRSLEVLADDIGQTQGDVINLDGRVTTNENDINFVKEDVGRNKEDIKNVKIRVNEQGQQIDEMGRVVDQTVIKVEEIDSKTLSHAPYWSRDVSKLLNPKTEHDWRLLSSRLGYSNDDIRSWSQQSDPCMAMLNEWYATRKTSEANYGVLNILQEMDRMDAAVIVENAMKAAEQVVEDEDFDYPTPPPIFLSYQWGHQEEVKLLRKHLEMAGYDCWMDIGQMGGGDKLFEKIDRGIRAAKIIISCTTDKYAKSPNCNREVNLAVNLKKPIIPLLLEQCPWPPMGSMGPLFSEYLYIQFFQSGPTEHTADDRYWPVPKFQELLMQLSMNGIVPDENKVNKMYKNWWMPLVEEIKIDKKKTANGGQKTANSSNENKQDGKSPDVFISYQWGKQKNIMLLYKRLTELGYDCWMDIHQMGGGDSLYDKIDRGVRGCKVVLSCLTEKYTLSANCRREVSLADALKRPIIPLLLESIPWPPKGPMSMAFTELLYIDFHSDPKVQEQWSGPKFAEMRAKIREILPGEDEHNFNQDNPEHSKSKAQVNQNKGSFVKSSKPGTKSRDAKPAIKSQEEHAKAAENSQQLTPSLTNESKPKTSETKSLDKSNPPSPKQSMSPAPAKSKSCQIL